MFRRPTHSFFVSLWNRGCRNSSARDVRLTAHVSLTCSVATAAINQDGLQICVSCIAPTGICTKIFADIWRGNKHLRQKNILANPLCILSGTCCRTLVRKTLMCDSLKFVPGVCSPGTLRSVAAGFKHLRFALRCLSLLTFISQFWHFHTRSSRAPLPPSFLESRHNKSTV